MKKVIIILLFCLPQLSKAQYVLDKGHSKFTFIAGHHGVSEVDGYFKSFQGKLTATKDDLSDALFEITIDTPSINTDLEMRDNHLKSEDMFDVVKFPTMTFKSTSFKRKGKNKGTLKGNITIKGVTKPINFDVVIYGPQPNVNTNAKNIQIGIKATSKIKRSDFGIGSKLATIMVSDEIQIRCTGELNKPI